MKTLGKVQWSLAGVALPTASVISFNAPSYANDEELRPSEIAIPDKSNSNLDSELNRLAFVFNGKLSLPSLKKVIKSSKEYFFIS